MPINNTNSKSSTNNQLEQFLQALSSYRQQVLNEEAIIQELVSTIMGIKRIGGGVEQLSPTFLLDEQLLKARTRLAKLKTNFQSTYITRTNQPTKFFSTLGPEHGGIVLGPYINKQKAIVARTAYLTKLTKGTLTVDRIPTITTTIKGGTKVPQP